jgi:hypothetical protein
MNRAAIIAAFAGLTFSGTTLTGQTQPGSPPSPDPIDPSKQPVPGATPGPGLTAKPKTPIKPPIVDLQEAAKQPRKRTPRMPIPPAAPNAALPKPQTAPSMAPAPAAPAPVLIEPMTPIVVQPNATKTPVPPADTKPTDNAPTAAPIAQTPAPSVTAVIATEPVKQAAAPSREDGPHISIIPAPANPVPVAPTAAVAQPIEPLSPSPAVETPVATARPTPAPAAAPTGVAVDIETVAVKPTKGELRQSPVQIGAQEQTRSARQPAPEEPAAATPSAAETTPAAPQTIIYDQRTPNPAAALLPAAPADPVLSPAFVEKWAADRAVNVAVRPVTPTEPTPKPVKSPEVVVTATEPTPVTTTEPTPAPAKVVAVKEPTTIAPAPVAVKTHEPVAVVPEPAPIAVAEPLTAPAKTTAAKEPEPVAPAVEPKPLEVQPSPEPLPPLPAPVAVKTHETKPIATTPIAPIEPKPVTVTPTEPKHETVKPVEVKGPEISPLNLSALKLNKPEVAAPPTTPSEPSTATVQPKVDTVAPSPVAEPIATTPPPATAPTTALATPPVGPAPVPPPAATAPPAQAAKTGSPEPVVLKVLSLTGTPGMVQWQVDGGTQWLIPELDETTKACFVVRTGPDAGVELQVEESTRVRLGRFSRAEVRTIDTTDEAGHGKRLNISLMRGVLYVTPGKGKVVTVQTPQRTLVVKEPMQITHDNGGTRSVSFTEQPNPGATAGASSANP